MYLSQCDARSLLVLAPPHTDDGEFGCGGTISKLVRLGIQVDYVAFSAAEESVPAGFPKDVLRHEVVKATAELGLPEKHVRVLHYPVRRFPQFRQDILEDIIKLKKELDPGGIVMCPSRFDIHQDHRVIADEAVRAFKDRTILGYEMPWNNLSITTSCFSVLEEQDIEQKNAALQCYMSQGSRDYINPEFIYGLARVRGELKLVCILPRYSRLYAWF